MKGMLALIVIVALALIASGCAQKEASEPQDVGSSLGDYGSARVTINGIDFEVEIPLKEEGFYQGLMFREKLDDGKGMLFAFADSQERTFWMKNTLIPLDMLFIDENYTIGRITTAIPCKSDPCPLYKSGAPVQYVLELRGGIAGELGIKERDKADIRFE